MRGDPSTLRPPNTILGMPPLPPPPLQLLFHPALCIVSWCLFAAAARCALPLPQFVITAGYISMLAAGGLLAILFTGAVVTFCVMFVVLVCTTMITLIVTGVPIGYAVMRLIGAYYGRHDPQQQQHTTRGMWANLAEEDQ